MITVINIARYFDDYRYLTTSYVRNRLITAIRRVRHLACGCSSPPIHCRIRESCRSRGMWVCTSSCRTLGATLWDNQNTHGDHSIKQREREFFYLTTHLTHFIYGYMASDIWLRTILIVRKETRCRHIGYSYRLTARILLYAPSHRQDNTYHGLCYTSRGSLAGRRNSSMGPPHEGSIRRPIAPCANVNKTVEVTNYLPFLGSL